MPYVQVATNVEMDPAACKDFLGKLTKLAAELLGKSEKYVFTHVAPGQAMSFGGGDDPAAYVMFKSINLPEDRTGELSAAICGFLLAELGVSPDRIYIWFMNSERRLVGWNSATF